MHRAIHSCAPVVRISSGVRLQPRLPLLVGKIQRSVVSTHPEKRNPTNCVRGENPRISILALNRLWILRFRPSGRCIHASLLNLLNLNWCSSNRPTHVPTPGWLCAELYPGTSPKQIKICRTGRSGKPLRWLPQPGYRPVIYPSNWCMVCAWPEMIQRTRSPSDTTPTTTPSSTTGR